MSVQDWTVLAIAVLNIAHMFLHTKLTLRSFQTALYQNRKYFAQVLSDLLKREADS